MFIMATISERRRKFVNDGLREETEGKQVTNKQKTKILKRLWKQAKRDIK